MGKMGVSERKNNTSKKGTVFCQAMTIRASISLSARPVAGAASGETRTKTYRRKREGRVWQVGRNAWMGAM